VSLFALIGAPHGGHAGGVDFAWIGPSEISLLIIVVLAITSRRSRKVRRTTPFRKGGNAHDEYIVRPHHAGTGGTHP